MELTYVGVGEAFEPKLGNASYLLRSEGNILIDCGYAVPRNLFENGYSSNTIDAIYITHFHADHFFGLPSVIFRAFEENRKKDLTIIGQKGTREKVLEVLHLAYPNLIERLKYRIVYIETTDPLRFKDLNLSFAKTAHPIPNFAIKVEKNGLAIGFSGDGALTEESKALFQDCHLLIHEAFMLEKDLFGHGNALAVTEYAKSLPNLKQLALVHIQREERKNHEEDFLKLEKAVPFSLVIPEPGDRVSI